MHKPTKTQASGRSRSGRDSGLRSHEEFTQVLRRAGYSEDFIVDVLGQLSDPINLQRDQQILAHYRLSSERLMDRLGGSP
jgi:hypothetical protein